MAWKAVLFFQNAGCMFFGELLCMFAYLISFAYKRYKWHKNKKPEEEKPKLSTFNPFIFLGPAVCDIISTSVMYIGLTLTTASSYQMLRERAMFSNQTATNLGALIVCTGLLSIVIVHARIEGYKWLGMLSVVLGLIVVGVTDFFFGDHKDSNANHIIVGDVLCVVAQVLVALQFVLEHKFLRKYDVEPLFAVGLEAEICNPIVSLRHLFRRLWINYVDYMPGTTVLHSCVGYVLYKSRRPPRGNLDKTMSQLYPDP
ncbi:unnamed protein product [Strongylus vulgaris]|uniref:EamA domain-containing protein n=1 Tax=Strongylus vulgaris TaxID=40348 RepID=A0A3P7IS60_STRVU|nr:unnamed protein product [Strongylus vulgaris]